VPHFPYNFDLDYQHENSNFANRVDQNFFISEFAVRLQPPPANPSTPMDLDSLSTPALVIDLDRLKRNAQRIGERVHQLQANLRPHVKTHKCIEVARCKPPGIQGDYRIDTG
jgi:hypothetical protein